MAAPASGEEPERTASPKARIVLVDDHELMVDFLRQGLEAAVEGLEVVASTYDGTSAVDVVLANRPDLVLMDIDMPGMGCFDAAAEITRRLPDIKIMFLSAHQHDEYIEEALRVGARGYALKKGRREDIIEGVRRVLEGELYYAPEVLGRVKTDAAGNISIRNPSGSTRLQTLTEREHQILIMLAKGESVKRIANALKIAYKTVDKHKVSLMKKLDIHDRVELCRFAVRERLIEA